MHSPLSLGSLVSYARVHRDGELCGAYEFVPRFWWHPRALVREMRRSGAGVVLFSHYAWTTRHCLSMSRAIKQAIPDCVTVHGGPSVPSYEHACADFMARHEHVDVAVRGEGEVALAELLAALAGCDRRERAGRLAGVSGITFRPDQGEPSRVLRTADREPLKDLAALSSPYLSGFFEECGDLRWFAAIVETNRGCPFECSFCDWGSYTRQKIRQFPLERVLAEIDWVSRNRIEVAWIADANFGVFQRDIEIAQALAEAKTRTGYPRQVSVSYAKNSTPRLAEIVRILSAAGLAAEGVVALQSTDPSTLKAVHRENIKSQAYYELLETFQSERMPVSTELMIGLPGATYASFKADLQFCFDRRVHAKAYATAVLPNAPIAHPDYLRAHGIEVDDSNFVCATNTASAEDIERCHRLYDGYLVLVEFGLLRYLLHFLQRDYGLKALDVIEELLAEIDGAVPGLEQVRRVYRAFGNQDGARWGHLSYRASTLFVNWESFFRQLAGHLARRHDVARDSALEAAMDAQEAVMPAFARRHPRSVALQHDLVAYLHDGEPHKPLREYPPRTLEIRDPKKMCWLPLMTLWLYGHHKVHFELISDLMFDVSAHRFLYVPDQVTALGILRSTLPRYAETFVKGVRNALDARPSWADLSSARRRYRDVEAGPYGAADRPTGAASRPVSGPGGG